MDTVSLVSRTGMLVASCLALPTLVACLDHPVKQVEYEHHQSVVGTLEFSINKDVDIIFMIDDSGSMAEEQVALAQNFEGFIRVLEAEDVRANYRIAITTSDNGNPLCGSAKTPEGGQFVLSSCRSRAQNFQFRDIDAFDVACASICEHDEIAITPTTTLNDSVPRSRPWIENDNGRTNLPDGISTTEAFSCFGPMGIAGCGFEEQLESVYRAITRTQVADEDQYDFIRPGALLAVVLVSDEADGSYNRSPYGALGPYDLEGSKVFWHDPTASFPTSAVSWNAGVECTPAQGDEYERCEPQHYDIDGNVVAEAEAASRAVFHPLSRYIDLLERHRERKKEIDADQEVLVAGILGVPIGYHAGEALVYRDDPSDEAFMADFGIGPGCVSALDVPGLEGEGKAVPPVRQRAFVEHFALDDEPNLFSICEDDWSIALQSIANRIRDRIRPGCLDACVADTDPTTDTLDPGCVLVERTTDGSSTAVPPCLEGDALPNDADLCYVTITGEARNDLCKRSGWNVEFDLVRRPGVSAPPGAWISATCELSGRPSIDCP